MAVKGADGGIVLVLDDHYAVESDEFYSRKDFERDFGALPFRFVFSPSWDDGAGQYTVEAALRAISNTKPQGILLDVMFGSNRTDRLGLAILRELTARYSAVPVVMMTSVARDELWTECARLGAVDYLPKPLDARLLCQTLNRYVGIEPDHWLIGQNRLFLEALNLAARAAEGGQTPVMISGESGTGKGLLARFIHRHAKRSHRPFELIDLSNIPMDMQAANLFGYRKGAFTGADRDEPGRFLMADGGVVFLDEIGDIDSGTQSRLLRVADTGAVTRLGDGKTTKVDVQIVSATNADLAQKIKNKEFRYDLWARLSGMPVTLPTLAQRRDDILLLVRHLLRSQAIHRARPMPELPVTIEAALRDFPWEGNVRGLRNYAQRVFDLASDAVPDEQLFLTALPPRLEISSLVGTAPATPVERPSGGGIEVSDQLQRLRLEELALIFSALERSRDPVTGAPSRAKAAALLKGKKKCSTNEFDRWVKAIWVDLSPESREMALQRFPELPLSLKTTAAAG